MVMLLFAIIISSARIQGHTFLLITAGDSVVRLFLVYMCKDV